MPDGSLLLPCFRNQNLTRHKYFNTSCLGELSEGGGGCTAEPLAPFLFFVTSKYRARLSTPILPLLCFFVERLYVRLLEVTVDTA